VCVCARARIWRVQYGPIFVETQVDPAKGGKVEAHRMGRAYELVVLLLPPTACVRSRVSSPPHRVCAQPRMV